MMKKVKYVLEVDVKCPKEIYEFHGDLPLLPERKKIKKVEKLVTNLCDKTEYVLQIRNLKQAGNCRFGHIYWKKP